MKATINCEFYQHQESHTLLMSTIKKLGCKRFVRRYCKVMNMHRHDVIAMLRGIREKV